MQQGRMEPVAGSAERAWAPGGDGEHWIQEELGMVARADRFYRDQVLDHLNPLMREFAACQEMLFLSTADRHGNCDSSFRAGPPGFVAVLDDRTLAYPEYRGNGVMASLGNIVENPHVGILMVDFFRDRIGLHINGTARLVPDEPMRAAHPALPVDLVPGRRPQMWVEVEVEEAYIHCSKHIPLLAKVPRGGERAWGTDDVKCKGGDYFGAAAQARAERGPHAVPSQRSAADVSRGPGAGAGPAVTDGTYAGASSDDGRSSGFRGWFG